MVLSYTTSPAYHVIAENSTRYKAAAFKEGHYLQIEVAGLIEASPEKELARKFLAFMMTPGLPGPDPHQQLDAAGRADLGTAARRLRHAGEAGKDAALHAGRGQRQNRRAWIDEWLNALAK